MAAGVAAKRQQQATSTTAALKTLLSDNKNVVYGVCGAAVVAYVAYRVYNSDAAVQLKRLRIMAANYANALSAASSTVSLVASDLHTFLSTDTNELPRSLRQLSKLVRSNEVQGSIQAAAASVARGVSDAASANPGESALDKILEAVLSERGRSLVGMAVTLATKNAINSVCENLERMQRSGGASDSTMFSGSNLAGVLSLLTSEQCEKFLSLLITKSIKTAVSTYVDATTGYNVYNDVLSSIAKPEHRDALTDIMTRVSGAFTREVVQALRKARVPVNANASQQYSLIKSASNSSLSSLAQHHLHQQHDSHQHTTITERRCSGDGSRLPPKCMGDKQPLQQDAQVHAHMHHRPNQATGLNSIGTRPATQMWLRQVVSLAKEQEVRSLAVDVVRSATREATRSAIETFMQGASSALGAGSHSYVGLAASMSAYRLYVLCTVAIAMLMYTIAPRTVL